MTTEIFYHGSSADFEGFDLAKALEGAGRVKFGYGVYVTSAYSSAAHYSGANPSATDHYVYTVAVPARRHDNYIAFKAPVHPSIAARAREALAAPIPEKALSDGKEFRKYLAEKVFPGSDKLEGERRASQFLLSIGVEFIEWPYNWKDPSKGTNRAIFDDSALRIVRVDRVALDDKKKLIPGSETQLR